MILRSSKNTHKNTHEKNRWPDLDFFFMNSVIGICPNLAKSCKTWPDLARFGIQLKFTYEIWPVDGPEMGFGQIWPDLKFN